MSNDFSKFPKLTFWRAVLVLILAAGFYSTVLRFVKGLGAATNLSDQFPWGIWIGFDVLCGVGMAAGGFTLAAIVYVFHIERFHAVLRPSILTAFLGYALVAVALLFDLGKPYNIWHPLVMWNPHSVMFEVAWCVMLYLTVLALEFSPAVLERFHLHNPLRIVKAVTIPLVIAGVLLSTLHQSSLGSLYLIVPEKLHPYWYSPLLPVFFFISAVGVGLAMVIFESNLSSRAFGREIEMPLLEVLGRAMAVVLAIYGLLKFQDLWGRGALAHLREPSTETLLFVLEITLGLLIPLPLLLFRKVREDRDGLFAVAVLVITGLPSEPLERLDYRNGGFFRGALFSPLDGGGRNPVDRGRGLPAFQSGGALPERDGKAGVRCRVSGVRENIQSGTVNLTPGT